MSTTNDLIHIIMTGGTIDSIWNGVQDNIVVASHSILPEYFTELGRNLKFYDQMKFSEVCMKDSRSLTNEDRQKIVKVIEESEVKKIIITHGTYTMSETARYIKNHLKRKDQVVILTGSMVPLKGFDFSDAPFNLGCVFAQFETLPSGVYVCMNARIFTPEEVAKNIEEGKFYSVFKNQQ